MKPITGFIPVCEPFLNGNELKYVTKAVSTGWISSAGPYVTEFENQFAKYCGCKHGVAVCNGTASLHLALVALGIGKGDEVIIPSFTMIASAFAVCYTGAVPVFVDADKQNWNIDINKIEAKITSRTKAIMPVHIFGLMCNMDAIVDIAKRHNLFIVEDAAEAHGAEYKGTKSGAYSDIGSFSFFANKNITTGEGGMIVTNNDELYRKAKYFKNLCFPLAGHRNYTHDDIGFNYRMSNVIAAIGLAQVEKADEYRLLRMKNNRLYRKYLFDIPGVIFQEENAEAINSCWMNAVVIDADKFGNTKRELVEYLKSNNIETRLLFNGMHKQESLRKYGCDCSGEYQVCDWLTAKGFYLPSASSLQEDSIQRICKLIANKSKASKGSIAHKEQIPQKSKPSHR
jgi:perosamine synthetase